MELPSHPDANDSESSAESGSKLTVANWILIGVIGALVLVVVILHLAGVVGPGSN